MDHLSRADGWNERLVLEQTRHPKFGKKVREAKDKVQPLFRKKAGRIVIGVRCNGGKQRSVAFARMIGAFLSRSAWVTQKDVNIHRWCGCCDCQGEETEIFLSLIHI